MSKIKQRLLVAQWFAAMASSPRTRITLANLKYDLGRRPPLTIQRLLHVLCMMTKKGTWTGGRAAIDAELAIETFLNNAPESVFCHGPEIKERDKLSLVTDDDVFYKCYVLMSKSALAVDRKHRVSRMKTIRPKQVRPGAMVQSRRKFAWVTDSDALEKQLDPRVSKRVRDFLGLIFKKPTQRLIELRYPPDVAKTLPLAAPTVIEGACVTVYKSTDGARGWGHALDLEHLCDGGVEAVHRPIPFTAQFTYRDLGPVSEKRERTETELTPLFRSAWTADDDALVKRYSRKTPRRKKSTKKKTP
ncbi:MAG TPA: hypothetical protein VJZ00_06475 [Thermoanaerobaculia bacterium]|nr:hypothetical protein [Thermoanaerobaculia bacterium]